MKPGLAKRLRIYLGESDHYQGQPLYHWIVKKARELGLAGATVYRGIEGFGATSRIHSARLLALSSDLPILVEIVDTEPYIEKILPFLQECLSGSLLTIEDVEVLKYEEGASK
ncbi:MAG: uncharacterized protein PWQ41_869 [Bacillota bacterium]|nr:uncharacterized protein [Bacillota bacterium]MDK2925095.1 uncharacterized protein [Bacillota bacterium]